MIDRWLETIPYNVTATVSYPELLWSLCAVVGVVVCLYYLWIAYRVYRGVSILYRYNPDEWLAEQVIARGNIRRGWWRFSRQAVALAVGVWAMRQPNGPQLMTTGALIIGGFLWLELTMVVCSVCDDMDRRHIGGLQ